MRTRYLVILLICVFFDTCLAAANIRQDPYKMIPLFIIFASGTGVLLYAVHERLK